MPVTTLKHSAKSKGRSSVSNGSRLFVDADARSKWGRRFKDLIKTYSAYLGGNPTPPQQSLIRRIATLDIETERMEGALSMGGNVDRTILNRMVGNLRRSIEQLEIYRSQGTKPDSLADIIAKRKAG